jgi:PTS system cellobiose-specific IIA component
VKEMEYVEKIMTLVAVSGEARSKAMEAIQLSKSGEYSEARTLITDAANTLRKAHKIQTTLIQEEAGGTKYEVTLLMVHAQDHLMTAMTVKDFASEFIDLYEKVSLRGREE